MKTQWELIRHEIARTTLTVVALLAGASITNAQPGLSEGAREKYREVNRRLAEIKPLMDRAEEHYFAGRFNLADEECSRATQMYEDLDGGRKTSGAHLLQAEIDLELGRFSEAVEQFEVLRRAGNIDRRVGAGLVVGYVRLSNLPTARLRLEELVEDGLGSAYHQAWGELSRLRTGGDARAIEALAIAIRGAELMVGDNHSRALRFLNKAAQLAPFNLGVSVLRGIALRQERRWTEAKQELQRASAAAGSTGVLANRFLKSGALPPRAGG